MSLIIYNTFVQSEEGMYYLLLPRTRELWYSGLSDETKVSQQESITKLTQRKLSILRDVWGTTLAVQQIHWLESPDFPWNEGI